MSNSDNPGNGAAFQRQVFAWLEKHYKKRFILEKKIPIGKPAKDHKFDIVDEEGTIAIECKRYTWTESGNVPSATMGFANEAAFYLTFLPESYEKYIVMLRSYHPKHQESLAEYYFRTNRHLLGKIKVAEYDPETDDLRVVGEGARATDGSYLKIIEEYLNAEGHLYKTQLLEEIEKRRAGKKYTLREHVRGMLYAFLSSQTKWYRIQPHLTEIDKLFFDYDVEKILAHSPAYYYDALYNIKCGNISTKAQMESLPDNIHLLQRIEDEYGSIDTFITSENPDVIVQKLSKGSSPYKVKMLGEALAWEYLRNVGIDGAKPDTHLRRFLGADRMGAGENSPATTGEVNAQVTKLSEQTGMPRVEIDNLIWSFCADRYGEICTATPHCARCPIADYCNRANYISE